MISDTINQKIAEALKAKDEIKLSTFRMLSSALNYEKIAKQHDLTQDEEIVVVRKEAKKRSEAIAALQQAQGKLGGEEKDIKAREKIEKEQKELEILKEFLPEEMSDEELLRIVNDIISGTGATDIRDMGRVIGTVMNKVNGRAEGSKVAQMVKENLMKK